MPPSGRKKNNGRKQTRPPDIAKIATAMRRPNRATAFARCSGSFVRPSNGRQLRSGGEPRRWPSVPAPAWPARSALASSVSNRALGARSSTADQHGASPCGWRPDAFSQPRRRDEPSARASSRPACARASARCLACARCRSACASRSSRRVSACSRLALGGIAQAQRHARASARQPRRCSASSRSDESLRIAASSRSHGGVGAIDDQPRTGSAPRPFPGSRSIAASSGRRTSRR